MSSGGTPAANQISYKILCFQGLAMMATAHFAGSLRCLEQYKIESLAMAGLGTAAVTLTEVLTETTDKDDFKNALLKAFVMGVTIIGASYALRNWSSYRTLPFDRAVRLVFLEFLTLSYVSVIARRFEHTPPATPITADNLTIPASAADVVTIDTTLINLYHERFQSNRQEWTTLPADVYVAFIELFLTHHYSIAPLKVLDDVSKENIESMDESVIEKWHAILITNQETLWNNLPLDKKAAFNDQFAKHDKDLLPWGDFETYPTEASCDFFWAHHELWKSLDQPLRSRLAQSYYQAELPVVRKGSKAKLTTDWLALPNSPEEVKALHPNQIRWLREIFIVGTSKFEGLPILVQHALNDRMLQLTGKWRHYAPLTVKILQEIEGNEMEEAIITRLHDNQFDDEHDYRFNALEPVMQNHLNTRFKFFRKAPLDTHAEWIDNHPLPWLKELNKHRAREWYTILSARQETLWEGIPKERKMALNTAFTKIRPAVPPLPIED